MEETFGELLKRLRVARGLSLRDLARLAGCSASYVSRIEHGDRLPPSREMTAAFAEALRLRPGGAWWDRLFLASEHVPPGVPPEALLSACRAIRADIVQRATAAQAPRKEAG